ncbi:hypothetical protein EUTSA_v10007868mg [Eutrema salsugineum]|uniref:Uncharacterized protein n=1 Tax=Eutrema salsugineum TaxID=72664 RepID=V4MSY1_EUTSA|nr:uncharacterized protein LOC18993029 [Eutrema salsugineum]ESQ34911.1 hypothetical protein EUTSA_v10007868mg [Eutrema salsugineum]
MTLLEVISNAVANQDRVDSQSDFPFPLSNDGIFANLKPKLENPNPGTLINSISGWEISGRDAEVIDLGKSFSSKLKRKLKDTNGFDKSEFVRMLKQFLEKIGEKVGNSEAGEEELKDLVEKNGFLMGRDVSGLVLKGSIRLEMWELAETLISNSLVDHSLNSYLVSNLVEKHRSDLLCVVLKQVSDLGVAELLSILKYFLCPSKEAINCMAKVREEWDSQALLAIEKASNTELSKKSKVAEEASVLLMVAHDGFSPSELCLHYLLASPNVDEVMFASAVSKLSGNEMSSFIRYLSKWMKKYERFPQAGPCPEAASMLGLKLCDWVPKLEDITKCLGLIIDENFSTLVLYSGLHEELKSIAKVADGLASESKLCCFVANVAESLRLGAARN